MGCINSRPALYIKPGSKEYEDTRAGETISTTSPPLPDKPLPPLPEPPKRVLFYRANYDYGETNTDDLAFKKGDRLVVETDSQESDWWIATNQRSGKRGYIPSNYVCEDDGSIQSQEWWFAIDHKETDRKLLSPGIKLGTFLVRESRDKSSYVLSVRDVDTVRHYRIKFLDNGGFYMNPKRHFSTIHELLNYHKRQAIGVCTLLTEVCPRVRPIPKFTDLEEKREKIKTTKLLGRGHFGEVWEGKLHGVFDVAVKKLNPGTMTTSAFLYEAKSLHELRHPNLVDLIAVCSENTPVLIVTELMDKGSLRDYFLEDRGKTISFKTILDISSQITCGMAFLESKHFVHRDLRAANVLVDKSLTVKIADLGLARELDDDEEIYTAHEGSKFPVKWTAPEALMKRKFSSKSDVWSFGILLHELITFGKIPYPGLSPRKAIDKIQAGYRMPKPDSPISYNPAYYDVMLTCWHEDPESRPTFSHLHIVFDDFAVSTEVPYV